MTSISGVCVCVCERLIYVSGYIPRSLRHLPAMSTPTRAHRYTHLDMSTPSSKMPLPADTYRHKGNSESVHGVLTRRTRRRLASVSLGGLLELREGRMMCSCGSKEGHKKDTRDARDVIGVMGWSVRYGQIGHGVSAWVYKG